MNSQWFYGCSRYPDCYGSLSANPDGSPRGAQKPRNFQKSSTEGPELENARRKATAAFASLKEHCTIKEACQWIRQATNLKRKQVFHPAQMNIEQCQQAIEAVKIKGPGTEFWELWKKSNLKKTLWDHLQEPDL
jgi:ssDNA-binding Zn-finger/Zn-ribbon topoisomerase 1